LDPTISQMNPVHTLTLYFFKIHFNIIFQSKPSSPKRCFSSGFYLKFYKHFSSPSCVLHDSSRISVIKLNRNR
jgi:hypothetical protein